MGHVLAAVRRNFQNTRKSSKVADESMFEVNGSDGVWVTGEFSQVSEMNHLMVSDSMRYAILM
ncbi:hypothetical protein LR48_Vigan09g081900 [Vigna angularis]|uniref:Uncharacterized protein n=1 Tax=Phaseolus angularis TaxID=3914 RepID=A0A0L9VAR1_PHAAN|nr:hypothetical protein LR48_Vigan09g081900 [Vigna angularis]